MGREFTLSGSYNHTDRKGDTQKSVATIVEMIQSGDIDTAKKLILKLVEYIQLRNSAKQEH